MVKPAAYDGDTDTGRGKPPIRKVASKAATKITKAKQEYTETEKLKMALEAALEDVKIRDKMISDVLTIALENGLTDNRNHDADDLREVISRLRMFCAAASAAHAETPEHDPASTAQIIEQQLSKSNKLLKKINDNLVRQLNLMER